MRKVIAVFFLFFTMLSCGRNTHFQSAERNAVDYAISEKNLHLISFFINESFSWYGEVDRFYGKFYTIEPAADYFGKQCLSQLNVFFDPRNNFAQKAEQNAIKPPVRQDYRSGEKQVLFNSFSDYAPLLAKIARPEDHFIIMEQMFEVIISHSDNRASLLTVNVHILNAAAKPVYSKKYEHRYEFDKEDYKVLVSFSNYNRNEIQKRIMQIYFENFIRITPAILADLKTLLGN